MFSRLNRTDRECFQIYFISSEAMNGSMPLVKIGLQISDPLYSVLDISKSNIKDVSRVTGTLGRIRIFLMQRAKPFCLDAILHVKFCDYSVFSR